MRLLLSLVVAGLLALPAAAATIDGMVEAGYGSAIAIQDTPTGFGDNFNELDAAYAILQGGDVSLMLTGNLEGNGNGLVIFIDSRAGGAIASTLGDGSGVMGSVGGARIDDWGTDTDGGAGVSATPGGGSILDPDFNPDVALEINAGGGGATYYTNIIDLTVPNDVIADKDIFLGANARDGSAVTQTYLRSDLDTSKGHGGTIQHAFDNSNAAGVTDSDASGALTATKGYEALISKEFLANDGQPIRMLAFITNGGGDFLANQFLGENGVDGAGNLGGPGGEGGTPLFDAREYPGNQFFVVVPEPSTMMLVGLAWLALCGCVRRRK
jgi:hypothetical protein